MNDATDLRATVQATLEARGLVCRPYGEDGRGAFKLRIEPDEGAARHLRACGIDEPAAGYLACWPERCSDGSEFVTVNTHAEDGWEAEWPAAPATIPADFLDRLANLPAIHELN